MKLNGTYAEQAMALLGADCNLASDRTNDRKKSYGDRMKIVENCKIVSTNRSNGTVYVASPNSAM